MKHPFTDEDLAAAYREFWYGATGKESTDRAIHALWDSAVKRGAVIQSGNVFRPSEPEGYFIKLPEEKEMKHRLLAIEAAAMVHSDAMGETWFHDPEERAMRHRAVNIMTLAIDEYLKFTTPIHQQLPEDKT